MSETITISSSSNYSNIITNIIDSKGSNRKYITQRRQHQPQQQQQTKLKLKQQRPQAQPQQQTRQQPQQQIHQIEQQQQQRQQQQPPAIKRNRRRSQSQWKFTYKISASQHSASLWRVVRSPHGCRAPLKRHFWGPLASVKPAYYRWVRNAVICCKFKINHIAFY